MPFIGVCVCPEFLSLSLVLTRSFTYYVSLARSHSHKHFLHLCLFVFAAKNLHRKGASLSMTDTSSAKRAKRPRTTLTSAPEIYIDFDKALEQSLPQRVPRDIRSIVREYVYAEFDPSSDTPQDILDKLIARSNSTLRPSSSTLLKKAICGNVLPEAVVFSLAEGGIREEDKDFVEMIYIMTQSSPVPGIFPKRYMEPWAEAVSKIPCDSLACTIYRELKSMYIDVHLDSECSYPSVTCSHFDLNQESKEADQRDQA